MSVTRARLAIAATFAANGLVFPSFAPRIPDIKHALALSDGSLGLALFAAPLGAMVAMPLAGAACSRWGSARTTRTILALYCLSSWLVGVAGGYAALWITLLLIGAITGSMDVAMNSQGVTVEQAAGRPVLTGFHAAWSLGALIGSAAGSLGAAWQVPLWLQLLALGLVSLLVVWPLTGSFRPDPVHADGAPTVRFALPTGSLLMLGVAAFAVLVCEGAAADWTAVHLRESLDASPGVAGWGFTAFMLAMTAGRLVGDRVLARWGRARTVQVGTVIGLVGVSAGLATASVAGVVIGFGVLGLGLSVVTPTLFGAAGTGPGPAGPSIAAVSTCGYAGWLIGPVLIGGIAEFTGLPLAMWSIALLCAVACVVAPVGIRRRMPVPAGHD